MTVDRRTIRALYERCAIVLMGTVLLALGVEAIATAGVYAAKTTVGRAIRSRFLGRPTQLYDHYSSLPYYRSQSWTERYWQEHDAALGKRYSPYVLWRTSPFNGALVKVDENGIRYTPGVNCGPGARKIFVFGGSVMWGWGAPDWGTIPAYLQMYLQSASEQPVCVVNYAEHAYVSTQSIIELTRLLEAGNVPAMAIFYDGINDVLAARWSNRAMIHQAYDDIAERLEETRSPLQRWARQLNSVTVMAMALSRLHETDNVNTGSPGSGPSPDDLSRAVADAYLNDRRIVKALAEAYGFEYHSFWQPHILVGKKRLTREEQAMVAGGLEWVLELDRTLVELIEGTYHRVEEAAAGDAHLHYFGNLFDDRSDQIWTDTWGHVVPPANEITAQAIAQLLAGGDVTASSR